MTSPLKPFHRSVSTSPFKINSCMPAKPSTSNLQNLSRKLFTIQDESDSDVSSTNSMTHRESSTSTASLQMKSTSDCSELIEEDKKQEGSKILECTLLKITINPRSYIVVPKSCYYLIKLIEEQARIPANHQYENETICYDTLFTLTWRHSFWLAFSTSWRIVVFHSFIL